MKILSSLSSVVSNLYEFLSSAKHKIFRRMLLTRPLMVPVDFHSRKKNKKYCGNQRSG